MNGRFRRELFPAIGADLEIRLGVNARAVANNKNVRDDKSPVATIDR